MWNRLTKGVLGHINDNFQAITTNMVQGWIREVN